MSGTPSYASTPVVGCNRAIAGDTSRTSPTTTFLVLTPGSSGAQIERITAMSLATTTKTTLRIWRRDSTLAFHLYCEIQIPAQNITGVDAVIPQTLEAVNYPHLFPLLLPSGWTLHVSLNDAQTGVEVTAEGGNF